MTEQENKQVMIYAMIESKDQKDALMIYCNKMSENDDILKKAIESDEKDFDKCWSFIEAKAKEHLKNKSGSVNPVTVFGWAIHYFLETNEVLEAEAKVKIEKQSKEHTVDKVEKKVENKKQEKEKPKSNVEVFSMFDFGVDDV